MFVCRSPLRSSVSRAQGSISLLRANFNSLPFFESLSDHASTQKVALRNSRSNDSISYKQLLAQSASMGLSLTKHVEGNADIMADLKEKRIALIAPPSASFAASFLAIWRQGGLAVPLCTSHPAPELLYVLQDSQASAVICHPDYEPLMKPLTQQLNIPLIPTIPSSSFSSFLTSDDISNIYLKGPSLDASRRALIIYTSGTTGRPKGAVHTHGSVLSQLRDMEKEWAWSSLDRILHFLPLHHVHGLVNKLLTPFYVGAQVNFTEVSRLWPSLKAGGSTVFMAVPTIYSKLIQEFQQFSESDQMQLRAKLRSIRLFVSGSAALPQPIADAWEGISGAKLLERYGMTETGMILTQPLHGDRKPGTVGMPFPSVTVRIVSEDGNEVQPGKGSGELAVKGGSLFKEYWQKPLETAKTFDSEGWFRTGDIVEYSEEDNSYRILGRSSVDIIKSGGYKISALDIETMLLEHPSLAEVAVVGVEDPTWGQRVAAVVSLRPSTGAISLEELRGWAKERMAGYKVPSLLKVTTQLPRNAMGKVNKKELVKLYFPKEEEKVEKK